MYPADFSLSFSRLFLRTVRKCVCLIPEQLIGKLSEFAFAEAGKQASKQAWHIDKLSIKIRVKFPRTVSMCLRMHARRVDIIFTVTVCIEYSVHCSYVRPSIVFTMSATRTQTAARRLQFAFFSLRTTKYVTTRGVVCNWQRRRFWGSSLSTRALSLALARSFVFCWRRQMGACSSRIFCTLVCCAAKNELHPVTEKKIIFLRSLTAAAALLALSSWGE